MISGIYKLRSRAVPELFYIGASTNLQQRKQGHSNRETRKNLRYKLYNHKKKYGFDDLEFSVVEYCEPDFLYEKEQYYISELKPPLNSFKFASAPAGSGAQNCAYRDFKKFNVPNLVREEYIFHFGEYPEIIISI